MSDQAEWLDPRTLPTVALKHAASMRAECKIVMDAGNTVTCNLVAWPVRKDPTKARVLFRSGNARTVPQDRVLLVRIAP
jgi:hypothetical protein